MKRRRHNDAAVLDKQVESAFDTTKLHEAIQELDAVLDVLEWAPDLVQVTQTIYEGAARDRAGSSPTVSRGLGAKPRSGAEATGGVAGAVAAITGVVRWRLERVRRMLLRGCDSPAR